MSYRADLAQVRLLYVRQLIVMLARVEGDPIPLMDRIERLLAQETFELPVNPRDDAQGSSRVGISFPEQEAERELEAERLRAEGRAVMKDGYPGQNGEPREEEPALG